MMKSQRQVTAEDTIKARRLRRNMPLAEKLLWHRLRQLPKEWPLSFRRQQVIHPYIADFACLKLKLLIERDGASHDGRQVYDMKRDAYLRSCGYTVLRFANDDILKDVDAVVASILAYSQGHAFLSV